MIVTTTNDLPGYKITAVHGVARGLTVRSRSALGNVGGAIQSFFGGNLSVVLAYGTAVTVTQA